MISVNRFPLEWKFSLQLKNVLITGLLWTHWIWGWNFPTVLLLFATLTSLTLWYLCKFVGFFDTINNHRMLNEHCFLTEGHIPRMSAVGITSFITSTGAESADWWHWRYCDEGRNCHGRELFEAGSSIIEFRDRLCKTYWSFNMEYLDQGDFTMWTFMCKVLMI